MKEQSTFKSVVKTTVFAVTAYAFVYIMLVAAGYPN